MTDPCLKMEILILPDNILVITVSISGLESELDMQSQINYSLLRKKLVNDSVHCK